MKTDRFNLQIAQGMTGIERLTANWKDIFASMPFRAFYHADAWCNCYLRHLSVCPDDVYICLISSTKHGYLAIIPLEKVKVRSFGVDVIQLRIPCHPHLPLRDILVSESSSDGFPVQWFIQELNKQLPFRWCFLFFDRVVARSNLLRTFGASGRKSTVIVHTGYSSYILLDKFESLASLSKNFRSNLSRSRNKLAKFRSVEVETTNERSGIIDAFEIFLRIEAAGWKGEEGAKSAIKLDRSLRNFYNCLMRNSSVDMRCEISILKVDSIPIAVQFGLVTDNTIYQLKIGYDESYSALSPGNMLMENLLREYKQRGLACFNLVSHTDWHKNWRAARDNLYSCFVFNNTPLGYLLCSLLRFKRMVAPIYGRTIRQLLFRIRA